MVPTTLPPSRRNLPAVERDCPVLRRLPELRPGSERALAIVRLASDVPRSLDTMDKRKMRDDRANQRGKP